MAREVLSKNGPASLNGRTPSGGTKVLVGDLQIKTGMRSAVKTEVPEGAGVRRVGRGWRYVGEHVRRHGKAHCYSVPVRHSILVGVIAMLAACGRDPGTSSQQKADGAPPLEAATAERILERVREPGATAVVMNVWATWCTPCREEFPDLMRLRHDYERQGMRLVLVSADFPDQSEEARLFLTRQGVDFSTFLKTGKDMEFINGLEPRWSGALPATFVYDGRGILRSFREGRTTRAALESLVVVAMTPQ